MAFEKLLFCQRASKGACVSRRMSKPDVGDTFIRASTRGFERDSRISYGKVLPIFKLVLLRSSFDFKIEDATQTQLFQIQFCFKRGVSFMQWRSAKPRTNKFRRVTSAASWS